MDEEPSNLKKIYLNEKQCKPINPNLASSIDGNGDNTTDEATRVTYLPKSRGEERRSVWF